MPTQTCIANFSIIKLTCLPAQKAHIPLLHITTYITHYYQQLDFTLSPTHKSSLIENSFVFSSPNTHTHTCMHTHACIHTHTHTHTPLTSSSGGPSSASSGDCSSPILLRSQTWRRLSVPLEARMVSLWGDH